MIVRPSHARWLLPFAIAALVIGLFVAGAARAQTALGDWHGVLSIQGVQLRLVLKVKPAAGGGLQAELISPDQSDQPLPIADIKMEGDRLTFEAPAIRATYQAQWRPASGAWDGQFTQMGRALPLVLEPGDLPMATVVSGLDGDWEGIARVAQAQSRLVLHVRHGKYGTVATLDVPDQLALGLPVTRLVRDGQAVRFEIPIVGASYAGVLGADGTSIAGEWKGPAGATPITLTHRATPVVVRRPQTPKAPFPYRSEEVAFESAPGVKLAGTLTLPQGRGPFPAAVMITGSGAQDRDETLLGHKPFAVIADDLTRRGIAVLRYDDRGYGKSTGDFVSATTEDFASDAAAGVAFLRTRADIDPARVGLIGHSEGGVVAPMVAAKDPRIGFVVLLAGLGVSGREALSAQRFAIGRAMGLSEEQARTRSDLFDKMVVAMNGAKDPEEARARGRAVAAAAAPGGKLSPMEEQSIEILASDWYRRLMDYNPGPVLAQVKAPVLAVNGSKDLQVLPEQNLPAIKAGLTSSREATTVLLPDLNHLLQTAKTGVPGEYADIEETVAPIALKTVGDWVVAHTKR